MEQISGGDGDELPLTHEFLGMMLGSPRPGVTLAVQALEREGLIDARRAWYESEQERRAAAAAAIR